MNLVLKIPCIGVFWHYCTKIFREEVLIHGKKFITLSENELMNVDGGMPFIVGVLTAGSIIVGSAVVVGGTTYGVKKLCEWVGSKFK